MSATTSTAAVAPANIPNAESIHQCYVAQNEWAKMLRAISAAFDVLAAALAVWTIAAPDAELAAWRPLLALVAVLLASLIREFGEKQHLLAQQCRRISLRALIHEADVSNYDETRHRDRVPKIAKLLARRLPTQSIWEYYGPVHELLAAGAPRMRQLYSYSAFYTWRQAKVVSWLALAAALLVLVGVLAVIYAFAVSPAGALDLPSLDILCTVILAFVVLRLWLLSRKAGDTDRQCEAISMELLRATPAQASTIESCADEYDYERVSGFQPITFVYNRMRTSLDEAWKQRRRAIEDPGTPSTP